MADYAALIGFTLDGNYEQVVLSTVDDTTINSSAEIATHPLVNGDVVADHMIKQPISLSLSGIIDNKEAKAILIKDQQLTLGNIQEVFERIQKEGILCDVTKIKVNEKSEGTPISFLTRQQMALNSISWTEAINSMTFSFNFTQVLMTDVLDYNIDPLDENLPDITMPEASTFATELLDIDYVDAYFIKMLYDHDLMTADFLDFLKTIGTEALIRLVGRTAAVIVGAAIGFMVGAAIAKIGVTIGIASATAGGPVGALVGAAVAMAAVTIACLVHLGFALDKWVKRTSTYRIKQFKKYRNAKKNNKEVQRFSELIESLHNQLNTLNNQILPFRIQVNQPQEALCSIGDQYYDFVFERNNTTNKWSMKLLNMNNQVLAEMANIQAAPASIMEENVNYLYKTNDNYYLYIIKSQESSDELDDLTNYCIVASLTDLSDFGKELDELLLNFIKR